MRFSLFVHLIAISVTIIVSSLVRPTGLLVLIFVGAAMFVSIVALVFYRQNAGAHYASAAFQLTAAGLLVGLEPWLIAIIVFLAMMPAILVSR